MLELWKDRKQIAEVRLIGGVSQQRRDTEDLFKRAQRGAVRIVDAVGTKEKLRIF
jgi:hypothetical protein